MPQWPSVKQPEPTVAYSAILGMATWFAIFAGIVEGIGLLFFQRLNWASWGPMLHVSLPILWISPLVDLGLFVFIASVVFVLAKILYSLLGVPPVRAVLFFLVFATAYDWLTLTGRLYHTSSLLLSLGVAVVFGRWNSTRQVQATAFWKRSLPALCMALLLILVAVEGGERWREHQQTASLHAADSTLPNIVVIVIDTLRADHLSSYGYSRPTSPTIDRLAAEGVLFQNAVATSSWSLPSHASLVTGRYVHEHGADNVKPIPPFRTNQNDFNHLPTIGEQLQQLGYRTGAFSANRTWFSHDLGFARGFIHFEDYFNSPADMLVRTLYGREFARIYLSRTEHSNPKRFLRWIGWDSLLDPDEEGSGSRGGALGVRKRARVVNRELEDWISADAKHPFFAFLNYFDVHRQYGGPRDFAKPNWPQETPVDAYDDSIRYVDDNIAQLVSILRARNLDKNTLIIITSDHGESLGEHGLETHGGSLYWNLIHVPLVLWWPGHIPANVRVPNPVTNATIPATLMSLIGKTPSESFRGPTLDSLWKLPSVATPPVLSELAISPYAAQKRRPPEPVPTAASGPMSTVVSGNWQLITHEKYGDQLYDWTRDPGETNNLADAPEGKSTAAELATQLRAIMGNSPTSPKSPSGK